MEDYQTPENSMPEIKASAQAESTQAENSPQDTYKFQEAAPSPHHSYAQGPVPQNNSPQYSYHAPQSYQPQNNYQPQGAYQKPGPYTQTQNGYRPQYSAQQVNYPPQNTYYPQNQYAPQYQNYSQVPSSGKATASLVLGIISLVLSWIAFANVLSIICGIIGVVLGAGARKELPPYGGRGTATAGMVCSIIALVISVLMLASFIIFGIFAASYVDYGFGSSYTL